MLVLSRHKNQTIMIGDNIEITVVDIRGDKVRLGISAPGKIPVHRKEVYEAIKLENKEAANVKLEDINAERFLTGEISKTWYDVKSLDARTSCFF